MSLALKAARWLAGTRNQKSVAAPLSIEALVRNPELEENRISKNRLEDIEQMRVDARPMELEKIGDAIGVDLLALVEFQQAIATEVGSAAATRLPPSPPDEVVRTPEAPAPNLETDRRRRRPRGAGGSAGALQ